MKLFRLLHLGLFLLLSQLAFSQTTSMADEASAIDTIPFELTDHNNISIKAVLNKKDTLDLMFHTAAGSISIIKSVTSSLETIMWNALDSVNSWGGVTTSRSSSYNTLEIGELKRDSVALWECENSGPKTDGKFGPNFFEGHWIELDFDQSLMFIHKYLPTNLKYFTKINLENNQGNMFIEGLSMIRDSALANKYLIHSGYGGAILFDDKFTQENKIAGSLKIIDEQELKDSYGNSIKVLKATLPLFNIGGVGLTELPVGFFDGSIGRQHMSVIGGDILKRFNIILDAERTHIYLKANSNMDLPFLDG